MSVEPPLSPGEREVVKSYGGWTSFSHSMGLEPSDPSDNAEAKQIATEFAADNAGSSNSGSDSGSSNNNGGKK